MDSILAATWLAYGWTSYETRIPVWQLLRLAATPQGVGQVLCDVPSFQGTFDISAFLNKNAEYLATGATYERV